MFDLGDTENMWYSADLFFESVHDNFPKDTDLWEEQVLLINANSEEEARATAEELGRRNEHVYTSGTGDNVHWVFRMVASVDEILDENLKSGTEVFSRFLRAAEVKALLTPFEE
jgi:hypothetical protein